MILILNASGLVAGSPTCSAQQQLSYLTTLRTSVLVVSELSFLCGDALFDYKEQHFRFHNLLWVPRQTTFICVDFKAFSIQ